MDKSRNIQVSLFELDQNHNGQERHIIDFCFFNDIIILSICIEVMLLT